MFPVLKCLHAIFFLPTFQGGIGEKCIISNVIYMLWLKFADHHCLNFLFKIKKKKIKKDEAKPNKDKKAK
jgi:hypothetical protein